MVNHRHICYCGAELECPHEPDHCAVLTSHWVCPTCDLLTYDDYVNRLASKHIIARKPAPDTHKEN